MADELHVALAALAALSLLPRLGITDVLYLENYEELRNLVFTSIKNVILTHKNIFWETDS